MIHRILQGLQGLTGPGIFQGFAGFGACVALVFTWFYRGHMVLQGLQNSTGAYGGLQDPT